MKQRLSSHGIGASEIAAIAGLSPYSSPWDIWLRKTGQAPDVEDNSLMEWGHRLEPAIRQKYADDTGATIAVPAESLFHREARWARATPDGLVYKDSPPPDAESLIIDPRTGQTVAAGAADGLLQCKNVGFWAGKDWSDGPPVYVQLQEHWEMYVTGLNRADVAALIAGSDYRIYTVHRDDKLIADLVTIAEDFWHRVETRTPPKVDASDACRDHFTRRMVNAPHTELMADDDLEAVIAQWHDARARQREVERDVKFLRNTVQATMCAAQCDRIASSLGMPKLARTPAREHKSTDWKYVAEMLAVATGASETFAELVSAATTTETTEATVCLKEPREWSKESK